MMEDIKTKLFNQESLSERESYAFFDQILRGEVEPIVLSALLTAMKIKGETPEEIAGAAAALRANAAPFPRPDYDFVDSCGTGGDGANTINISTASAFVAAACGLKVAKHGNRSVSSKSGSADLLEALGIKLDMSAEQARRCLDNVGLCFLFAPQYHQGVRHAMPVRIALKTRTIFNLLGPLISPATPEVQLMGVYDPALLEPIARTMQLLGVKRALVVNGSGLDEIAIHGPTDIVEVDGDELRRYQVTPEELGVAGYTLEELAGGDAAENATLITALLKGQGAPAHAAAVAVNVAALLYLSNVVGSLKEGVVMARESIAGGAPFRVVEQLAEASQ